MGWYVETDEVDGPNAVHRVVLSTMWVEPVNEHGKAQTTLPIGLSHEEFPFRIFNRLGERTTFCIPYWATSIFWVGSALFHMVFEAFACVQSCKVFREVGNHIFPDWNLPIALGVATQLAEACITWL